MGESYPQYYLYEGRPVAFVATPGGGLSVWALSGRTGEFELNRSYVDKIWFGTTADIDTVSRQEFVQRVEEYRGRHLHGEGPVYALYETINALEDASRAEAHRTRQVHTPHRRILVPPPP